LDQGTLARQQIERDQRTQHQCDGQADLGFVCAGADGFNLGSCHEAGYSCNASRKAPPRFDLRTLETPKPVKILTGLLATSGKT